MAKPKAGTNITGETVDMALRDMERGITWEYADKGCAGLSLRVTGSSVHWSFRGPRLAGKNPRWVVGDHTVDREKARERAHEVRRIIRGGMDPTIRLREMTTGILEERQHEIRVVAKPSLKWEAAIDEFETHLKGSKRRGTVEDYIPTLRNADVLRRFRGRDVCDITRSDVMKAVNEKRLQGVRTHHKKILVVTRILFNWLAEDARRDRTSVEPDLLTTAKSGDPLLVTRRTRQNKGIPDAEPVGRALAIARSGVLGDEASDAIQLVLGTLQRRHPVCALLDRSIRPYEPAGLTPEGQPAEYIWFVPPQHRKTADKIQSSDPHQVPLVGFVPALIHRLRRRFHATEIAAWGPNEEDGIRMAARRDGKQVILLDHADELDGIPPELLERVVGILPYDWLLPVTRPRRNGEPNKQLYLTEDTLNKNMNAMPGVAGHLSPHALRRKIASEGKAAGVLADGEVKMILDHLEGEAGNVTRGHYDLDPRIPRKREILLWWTGWLEEQCKAAIEADPTLDMSNPETRKGNFEALREACYIQRYGQEKWDVKLSKSRRTGNKLWAERPTARKRIAL
jgi:hypothetical protein